MLTGIVQSLGTKWGLFRHYWVLAKLVINLLATIILLLYTQTLSTLAGVARDTAAASGDPSPVLHAGVDPAWSPDSKWIAFSAPIASGFAAIFVIDPQGRFRNSVADGETNRTDPAWAPDSNRILFEEEYFLGHDFDVAYVTLDGSGLSGPVSSFPWSEHSPAWQPRT